MEESLPLTKHGRNGAGCSWALFLLAPHDIGTMPASDKAHAEASHGMDDLSFWRCARHA